MQLTYVPDFRYFPYKTLVLPNHLQYDPLDVFWIADLQYRYDRGEFLNGGGNFMSVVGWRSNRCYQPFKWTIYNDNIIQLYPKRFSSLREHSLLWQVPFHDWVVKQEDRINASDYQSVRGQMDLVSFLLQERIATCRKSDRSRRLLNRF